ncbi:MAG: DEAD/DEAH box helicase [Thermodesulfobacteriota bacterium]
MSFEEFNFHPKIAAGIAACGYTTPTPIQEEAIPSILAGKDVFGLAQTGTGKTAAFVLPLFQRLIKGSRKKARALIMAPTRELAEQTHDEIRKMAGKTHLKSVAIYGGVGKSPQIRAIRAGAEIIVACPGRLLDLFNEGSINLGHIEVLILDEADHMFDKGFLPDIRRIVTQLPKKRQSLVFSATMPLEIRRLAEKILHHPVTVKINHSLPASTISHALFHVKKEQRTAFLKHLIKKQSMTSTIVFTRTKHKAKKLAKQLHNSGFSATSLQGNLTQQNRKKAMDGFRNGTFKILVATDIAARGIDVSGISHVVNFDLPDTVETYTHRTGRTGRALKKGQAYSLVGQDDKKMIALIEKNLGKKISRESLPLFEPEKQIPRSKRQPVVVSKGARKRRCLWSESLAVA